MNPGIKGLCILATLGALAACEQPAALGPSVENITTGPALSADQVRGLIVGNTATGPISGSHITFKMYVAADGSATANLPTGLEHGQWTLSGNGDICFKWTVYRSGEQYCQRVYPAGSSYKFVNANSEELFTFVPGNQLETPKVG
jgi:hypothetical protein